MVNHSNEQLEKGKTYLESLGYSVEMGARHLNVTINDDTTNDEMEVLEKELTQKSGVECWVMQENIIIDIADNLHLMEGK